MKIAALDIGGTSIKSGVWNGQVMEDTMETATNARNGGAYVMERAKEILRSYSQFEAIGISTAGQVDSVNGRIRYANENIPGYTGMEIKKILEEAFGVPVSVENDVNAAALGEAHFGAGKTYRDFLCLTYGTGVGGAIVMDKKMENDVNAAALGEAHFGAGKTYRDFLCLTYGTGVGGAIVMDKKIYSGSMFSAGEFGAITVHPEDIRPGDPFSGCYEHYASVTALVKKAKEYDKSLENGRMIFERLEEEPVQRIVDSWIDEIVYGLSTVIHIFNPSCVILGGGVMAQPYILKQVKEKTALRIMDSFRNAELKTAELGNHAGMLGAAWLAGQKG